MNEQQAIVGEYFVHIEILERDTNNIVHRSQLHIDTRGGPLTLI